MTPARTPDNEADRKALQEVIDQYAGVAYEASPWCWGFPTTGAATKARERLGGMGFAVWRCVNVVGLRDESVPPL